MAGDDFVVVESESRAREIAEYRDRLRREKAAAATGRGTLEDMFSQITAGAAKELPIVIKGDVQGSVEAIASSLNKLSTDEVAMRVLHSGVGGINESDVILAKATGAVIVGFNVRANPAARNVSPAPVGTGLPPSTGNANHSASSALVASGFFDSTQRRYRLSDVQAAIS